MCFIWFSKAIFDLRETSKFQLHFFYLFFGHFLLDKKDIVEVKCLSETLYYRLEIKYKMHHSSYKTPAVTLRNSAVYLKENLRI